ncbi:MAG: sporulation membrane protein YtaF [Bacillota bacterium]
MAGLYLLVLAAVLSVDGFLVGLTYGMRRIRLPICSRLLVAFISGLLIGLALLGGQAAAQMLDPSLASGLGGTLLVVVGVWTTATAWSSRGNGDSLPYLEVHLPRFGLVIAVLREPVTADLDHSGSINLGEAGVLGVALALDAFGVGFGAGMAGAPVVWLPVLTALGMYLCLGLGFLLGARGSRIPASRGLGLAPGGIIAILGAMKILGALPQ